LTYDELLIEADGAGLIVKEAPVMDAARAAALRSGRTFRPCKKRLILWLRKWAITIPLLVTSLSKILLIVESKSAEPVFGGTIKELGYRELSEHISISAEIRTRQPNILTYQRKPLRRP